jgi:hypothetical protein
MKLGIDYVWREKVKVMRGVKLKNKNFNVFYTICMLISILKLGII